MEQKPSGDDIVADFSR